MSVLDKIIAHKHNELAFIKEQYGDNLPAMAMDCEKPRPFYQALCQAYNQQTMPIIAEIKKASPSKGVIRADFDAVAIGEIYAQHGASALSILTEDKWFLGDNAYLKAVKEKVFIPVLRKDFLIDPAQIYYSRLLGADCILLILAILSDSQAKQMEEIALKLGMGVLIETHNLDEVKRANAMSSPMIGVNNRNLATLEISLHNGFNLLSQIRPNALPIAESGLNTPQDCQAMWQAGARGFLIGESLMKQPNLAGATQFLISETNQLLYYEQSVAF